MKLKRIFLNIFYAFLVCLLVLFLLSAFAVTDSDIRAFLHSIEVYKKTLFFVALFSLSYLIVFLALNHQTRFNIEKLYQLLPELNQKNKDKVQNVESLSEEITNISLDKTQEIDVLIEKENYRREFLGNVAHELKTPLFSIQGFLLTLIEGGVDDNNIRDKYLSRINKSVDRLTYIVKDLDLITDLETGSSKLELFPFNIIALVQEVFDLLEIKAENNDIQLRYDKKYNKPIRVMGDIEKIEQVLTNLIANAINHSQRAATVTVTIAQVNNKVKVSIKDTGVGIKADDLNRIFERFYRVDKSRSRNQGGSGLGLAIVKHILEAHHQKVFVKSEYKKGTEFYFYLNKAEEN